MRDGISTPTTDSVDSPSEGAAAGADPFKATVAPRFGILPNFFCSAPAAPGLIEELWAFAKSAYLDSPLPSLFKERLFVHLSRFCEVRYCIVRHVGFLVGEGRPAGDAGTAAESVEQALALLVRPVPGADTLAQVYERLRASARLDAMPSPETQTEADLFDALSVIFLVPNRSAEARAAVRHAVGDEKFELLTAFLAFVRTAHYWTETHPEIAYEPDVAELMAAHPALAAVLLDTKEAEAAAKDSALRQALETSETAVRESEERQAFLLQLSDTLRPIRDPVRIMAETSALLGRRLAAGRCGYGEVDDSGQYFIVQRDWTDGVMPSFRGTHLLEGFGPEFVSAYRAGRTVLIDDALADERAAGKEAAFEAAGRVRASLGVPMVKEGRFVAGLFVQQLQPRHWTAQEEALAVEVAERTWAAVERARAKLALRESEARFRLLADNISQLAWTCDSLGNVNWYNQRWLDYTGLSFAEMKSWGWEKVQHPDHVQRVVAGVERAAATGEPWEDTFPLRRYDDQYRWFYSQAVPIRDAAGNIVQWFGTNTDITELREAEAALRESDRHQRLLLTELQHRVRNTLAVVRSIARRTADNTTTVADMLAHFQGRLDAFSRVQAALTRTVGGTVNLMSLVEDELVAHAAREGEQVSLDGPEIALEPRIAERLSLAVHELTTNAVKHGALTSGDGRIQVRWKRKQANGSARLLFNWRESGVEIDEKPEREGFGMELLLRSLPYDLQAETKVELNRTGLEFDLDMPLREPADVG